MLTHKQNVSSGDLARLIKANIELKPLLELIDQKGVEKAMEEKKLDYKKFIEHMNLFKAEEFSWDKIAQSLSP